MSILDELERYATPQAHRDGRYWGAVYGVVTNINDPAGQGRVKARIAAQGDNEECDWLSPCWPGSIEAIPNKGDQIVVMFVHGDPHRGVYSCFPSSNTKNRPTEAMVLGTTAWGMINFLVTQFNQLRADFNGHTHAISLPYNAGTTPSTLTGATGAKNTTAIDAQKGKAADGSMIADKSTSEIVLSGKAKLR